jgi:hypothetical protein
VSGISNAELVVEVVKSRKMQKALVEKLDLISHYNLDSFKLESLPLAQHKAIKKLAKNTQIKITKGGLIVIMVEDQNPVMAARIANLYVKHLDYLNENLNILFFIYIQNGLEYTFA